MATAATEIKVTSEIAAEHGVTAEEYVRIQKILGFKAGCLARKLHWKLARIEERNLFHSAAGFPE